MRKGTVVILACATLLLGGCADGGLVGHLTSDAPLTSPEASPVPDASGSRGEGLVIGVSDLQRPDGGSWSTSPSETGKSLASCAQNPAARKDHDQLGVRFTLKQDANADVREFYQTITLQPDAYTTSTQTELFTTEPYKRCVARRLIDDNLLTGRSVDQVSVSVSPSTQDGISVLTLQASTTNITSTTSYHSQVVSLSVGSARSELYFPRVDTASRSDEEFISNVTRSAILLLQEPQGK